MVRRSILTVVREEPVATPEPALAAPQEVIVKPAATVKPSRQSKLHIGGYYDPSDSTIVAFQKLGIDLRSTQQEMILEALRDFVAKHQAANAFQ